MRQLYPQYPPVRRRISTRCSKVIEALLRSADHVLPDERRTFTRAVFRMLEAALPFDHGPTVVTVLRKLAEHLREINLPITG